MAQVGGVESTLTQLCCGVASHLELHERVSPLTEVGYFEAISRRVAGAKPPSRSSLTVNPPARRSCAINPVARIASARYPPSFSSFTLTPLSRSSCALKPPSLELCHGDSDAQQIFGFLTSPFELVDGAHVLQILESEALHHQLFRREALLLQLYQRRPSKA